MEHLNLKIKTFDEQVTQMINASGLPISVLYYMFSNYVKELSALFDKEVNKDLEDLRNSPSEPVETKVEMEDE